MSRLPSRLHVLFRPYAAFSPRISRPVCPTRVVSPALNRSFHSSPFHRDQNESGHRGVDPNHPLIQQLASNPHILHSLTEFTQLLQEKGLDVTGAKPPSFMQMMKLMTDSQIKEKVGEISQQFQAAGIQLDMSTIMELSKAMQGEAAQGEQATQYDTNVLEDRSSTASQDQPGLMSKMKNIFGKK
ncbi:uncharacterized protein VTP21DRAFT_3157 [Calcarisporiella thermophila]|uniref:uncharacterized protein n=1 Tax=Calcarisporiella thermophila TaxID=911321 RepID=UPI0037436A98